MTRPLDLTGNKFNKLTAIEIDVDKTLNDERNDVWWVCACECGNIVSRRAGSLNSGKAISCGCNTKITLDKRHTDKEAFFEGKQFNKLFILKAYIAADGNWRCICKCDCGAEKDILLHSVKTGRTKSCGCSRKSRPSKYKIGYETDSIRIIDARESSEGEYFVTVLRKTTGNISEMHVKYVSAISEQSKLFCSLIRSRLRAILKGGYVGSTILEYIGCSPEELAYYLTDSCSVPWSELAIDHICPLHQATNDEETLKLQHYTNLRLIQKSENSSKGNRATAEGRQLCKTLLGREWIYE